MDKILIVEDDLKLSNELKLFLTTCGYEVFQITSFDNTIEDIIKKNTDLILLDINIPNINGQIVCKELRKKVTTPIIIVTSKNTIVDELISLNYGADDFITKPYNTDILLARIERLLKRNNSNTITYDKLTIDLSKSQLIKDNEVIDLSKNELKILSYLLNNKNRIASRDDIINYLWDANEFIDDNTLTVNINRLRSKLEQIGYPDMIKTKRGQGYIII